MGRYEHIREYRERTKERFVFTFVVIGWFFILTLLIGVPVAAGFYGSLGAAAGYFLCLAIALLSPAVGMYFKTEEWYNMHSGRKANEYADKMEAKERAAEEERRKAQEAERIIKEFGKVTINEDHSV